MTKARLIFSMALLSCVLVGVSCLPEARFWESRPVSLWPAPVKITGVDKCANFSLGEESWFTTPLPDNPGGLLVREGDLLDVHEEQKSAGEGQAGEKRKEESFPFLYEQADGTNLAFKTEKCRLLLNGKTVALSISGENGGWEWLEKASEKDISELRFFDLESGEIGAGHIRTIEKLARLNPHIGLAIDKAALRTALPLFSPRRLVIVEAALDADDTAIPASWKDLETLWFNADGIKSLEFLTRLPRLRRVVLDNWDPEQTGNFPLGCERLKSLTLKDFKGKDLSTIRNLPGLQQLDLMADDSFADISALSDLPQLEILNLFTDTQKMDLSVLGKCGKLRWLGLVAGKELTQEQFAQTIARVPRLRALVLIGAEEVKDLSPLRRLPELQDLVLVGSQPDLAPLREMKNLRFLMLQRDYFEKTPDAVRKLRADLLHCEIVPGKPLCLGSGWILLLVPGVAAVWFARRRRKEVRSDA